MNPYAAIDDRLNDRASKDGWTVFKEWGGAPARFFYVGGDGPWDCFQISLGLPDSDEITITAVSVDTNDGKEFEESWRGAIVDFDDLLTAAVSKVEVWKRRAK